MKTQATSKCEMSLMGLMGPMGPMGLTGLMGLISWWGAWRAQTWNASQNVKTRAETWKHELKCENTSWHLETRVKTWRREVKREDARRNVKTQAEMWKCEPKLENTSWNVKMRAEMGNVSQNVKFHKSEVECDEAQIFLGVYKVQQFLIFSPPQTFDFLPKIIYIVL